MKVVYIYALINPIDNKPFYVGATINTKQRLAAHNSLNVIYGKAKYELTVKIHKLGLRVKIKVLKKTDTANSEFWERYYFNKLNKKKAPLLQKPGKFSYHYKGNNAGAKVFRDNKGEVVYIENTINNLL